jgi:hypothetical protein
MFTAEGKQTRDYSRRKGGHHAQPKAWCHSGGSLPARDGSHSTDQPKGTEDGHAGLSVGFSKVIPANDTSKTEYSNTQQGFSEIGYTLARNYTHEGIVKVLGSFSAEKQQRV